MEKRGRLGRKNGKGFYDYPQDGPKRLWPGLAELQPTKLDPDTIDVAGAEAAPARDAGAGDRALLRGGRAHRRARGRCRLDPRLRLRAVHRRHAVLYRHDGREALRRTLCQRLEKKHGARFAPPKLLLDMAAKGETFYGRFAPGSRRTAAVDQVTRLFIVCRRSGPVAVAAPRSRRCRPPRQAALESVARAPRTGTRARPG